MKPADKKFHETNYNKIIFVILILAFAIRLLGIQQPFNEDELHWAYSASAKDWFGTVMRNTPLSIYAMNTVTTILGVQIWTIRLTFIIIGLLTILATAKLAKEQYNKRTAIIAALLLAINPLQILASLQAAYEGSVLTLFFVTALYCLHKYTQTKQKKWICWTGTAFGLAILSKTSALLLLPPIMFIYLYINTKKFGQTIIQTAKATAVGVALFIAGFALPSIISQSPALINAITQLTSQADATRTSLMPLLFQYAYAMIWIGPLFIIAPILCAIHKKADSLNLTAIIYVFLFYLLAIREATPPMERYFMILLPSLSILSAVFADDMLHKIKSANAGIIFSATAIMTLLLNTIINIQKSTTLPFYPKSAYIEHAINLNWNFLIPITGSSGPLGFYINFETIAFKFLITAVLFLTYIITLQTKLEKTKKEKIIAITSLAIIAASFGGQLFFTEEYLLSALHPNINQITLDTIDYINLNKLDLPIYHFKNYALFYHFNEEYKKTINPQLQKFDYFNLSSYNPAHLKELRTIAINQPIYQEITTLSFGDDTKEKSEQLRQKIKKDGATIVFIDFPQISKTGELWQTINNNCKQTKTFADKNQTISYVFECEKDNAQTTKNTIKKNNNSKI